MAICDPIVVALTFNPELIIKSSKVNAEVELNGKLSRGQLVVDWLEIDPDQIPRLEIILKLNLDAVKDMMINAAQF